MKLLFIYFFFDKLILQKIKRNDEFRSDFRRQSRFDGSIARYRVDHRTVNRPEFHPHEWKKKVRGRGSLCKTRSFLLYRIRVQTIVTAAENDA